MSTPKSIFEIDSEEEYLKYKDSININRKKPFGETALFKVPYKKAKWLIKHNIDIHSKEEHSGKNALFYSDFHTTSLLIKRGIDINIVDKSGNNALFMTNNISKVKLLLKGGININQVNGMNQNALFKFGDNPQISKLLIESGIDISHVDKFGQNALSLANCGTFQLLVDKGININQRNIQGNSLLSWVDYAKAKILIDKIYDFSEFTDERMEELHDRGCMSPEKKDLITKRILQLQLLEEKKMLENILINPHEENKHKKRL